MKKIGLYLCSLLAVALATSCQEEPGRGIAQTNPQGPVMSAEGITIQYGDALNADAIDLTKVQGQMIDVMSYTVTEEANLPENPNVRFDMVVATDEAFSNAYSIPVVDGKIAANDWIAATTKFYGLAPVARENYVGFVGYCSENGNEYRIGGPTTYFGAKKMNVVYDAKLPVENAYYLVLGDNQRLKLDHSDKHPYDDPNFSLIFEVTTDQANAGLSWYIVPESQLNADINSCYGVSATGDTTGRNGSLTPMGEGGEKGIINLPGKQMIQVNMLELTYKINMAFDYMYTPGPANGWGFGDDNMRLFTNDFITYNGYVYVEDMFKLTAQPSWSGLEWGGDDNGNLVTGGPNINRETGLYWVSANVASQTFSTTLIETIGMIGGFNGWGGDVAMTPDAQFKTWTGTLTTEEATEFKFRCNAGWDINLGGTVANLVPNGDNLSVDAGTYTVVLNLGTLPYTCTITKK